MANTAATSDVLNATPRVHTTPHAGPPGGAIIEKQQQKDWVNILFLTITPVIGILGTAAYTWYAGFQLWMPLLMVGMYLAVGMSICAGYHRFFSHKSYDASAPVQRSEERRVGKECRSRWWPDH